METSGPAAVQVPLGAQDELEVAVLWLCRVMVAATISTGNAIEPSLSPTQIRTLTVLSTVPAGASLGWVADNLGASTSATSRICARLVRDGLVERGAGPGNEIRLALSAAGRDALTRLNRARLNLLVPYLDAVPGQLRDRVAAALIELSDAVIRSGPIW